MCLETFVDLLLMEKPEDIMTQEIAQTMYAVRDMYAQIELRKILSTSTNVDEDELNHNGRTKLNVRQAAERALEACSMVMIILNCVASFKDVFKRRLLKTSLKDVFKRRPQALVRSHRMPLQLRNALSQPAVLIEEMSALQLERAAPMR